MTKQIINAFHPDYVKTYHPELLTALKSESVQAENGRINGAKSKKAHRESFGGNAVQSLSKFPQTKPVAKIKKVSTDVSHFYHFSKAGTK